MTGDDASDAMTAALRTLLRRHAAFAPSEDELQFTVELVLAAAEADGDDRAAVARGVRETLADVGFLDDAQLPTVVDAVAALVFGDSVEEEEQSGEENERRQQWHAVLAHYAAGERCLAVLDEDGEWHPARVQRHLVAIDGEYKSLDIDELGDTTVDAEELVLEVEFIEFGKSQRLALADVVMDEDVAGAGDDDDDAVKVCAMCERPMNLTAHHVIPRVTHAKYLKMGYTREFLNTCIMICRQCHSKVHAVEDEKTLARNYNTLDKIVAHPEIARWIAYAKKQKARIKPSKKSKWRVGT
jgi:hypothetical protein